MSDHPGEASSRGGGFWDLDPLVAAQKRESHLALLNSWASGAAGPVLKTDLYEEAHGDDELLSGFPEGAGIVGMDLVYSTVAGARHRAAGRRRWYLVTDCRQLGVASERIGCVFSNSTLDHFSDRADIETSVRELARVLKPGGTLIVTLDNPRNPLYGLLRLASRLGWTPFVLGETVRLDVLTEIVTRAGLEVVGTAHLIHNPRLVSSALFVALRRVLGRRAGRVVRALLRLFARLDRLPTRERTACFIAVCGRKTPSRIKSRSAACATEQGVAPGVSSQSTTQRRASRSAPG